MDETSSQMVEEGQGCQSCFFRERISEKICEQSGVFVVTKISSEDRMLQCTVEQTTDVPVPRMKEHLKEVPKIVFPSLRVVEEPDPQSSRARG